MDSKKLDKINFVSLIVSLLALGLATFSTIKSCSSEKDLKKTNYAMSSLDYRPRLKLSNPEIVSINLVSDTLPEKKNLDEADSIGNLFVRISLVIKIKVTNIGNNNAKLMGYAITDTISYEPILKELLKSSSHYNVSSKDTLKIPHLYKDLIASDTMNIELEFSPQFISNNQFIIHVLLLYENELGQLFDTYYWLDYKTNDIIIPNPIYIRNDKNKLDSFIKGIFKTVEFKDENNYSSIYSEDEKVKVLKMKLKTNK